MKEAHDRYIQTISRLVQIDKKLGIDRVVTTNNGIKFERDSVIPELMYPGTVNKVVDPIYSAGNVRYAVAALTTGKRAAYISDTFYGHSEKEDDAVIENCLGSGLHDLH